MLGIEPSTFVSKIDILTTTPIVHKRKSQEKVIVDFDSIFVYRFNWTRLRIVSSESDLRFFFQFILRPTFDAFISRRRKTFWACWKHNSNINSAKHLFCNSPECAYGLPPNHMRILVKSDLSNIPTLVSNSKCMKPRIHVCEFG